MTSKATQLQTHKLGTLCGLMPGGTPSSDELHSVVQLISGISSSGSSQDTADNATSQSLTGEWFLLIFNCCIITSLYLILVDLVFYFMAMTVVFIVWFLTESVWSTDVIYLNTSEDVAWRSTHLITIFSRQLEDNTELNFVSVHC